jgi:hypothetical protein
MQVNCAFDKLVSLSELKPHPKNRNKHPKDQIERLAKILKAQGWRAPIRVSTRSGYITAGHGRLMAAQLNGWNEVPVDYQDYESDDLEYADVQADNAVASWAELDLAAINLDLADLGPDLDVDLIGIRNFSINLEDTFELEEAEEKPVKYMIEVQFPNEMEMRDILDELTSRGYIVKERK